VLAVLAGEVRFPRPPRNEKVSEQSIHQWKSDFVEAGKVRLIAGRVGPSTREQQLKTEVVELATHWMKRIWRCGSGRSQLGAVVARATQPPAWGHRKIWAMARHSGYSVTASTVLRILDDEGAAAQGELPARTPSGQRHERTVPQVRFGGAGCRGRIDACWWAVPGAGVRCG
jgi:transposase